MKRTPTEVGEIIRRRREYDLRGRERKRVQAVAEACGYAEGAGPLTQAKAERGELPVRAASRAALAAGLDWPPDAIDRLLDGDEPASLDDPNAAEARDILDFIGDPKRERPGQSARLQPRDDAALGRLLRELTSLQDQVEGLVQKTDDPEPLSDRLERLESEVAELKQWQARQEVKSGDMALAADTGKPTRVIRERSKPGGPRIAEQDQAGEGDQTAND